MQPIDKFLSKYDVALQICLLLVAGIFLSLEITRPLANYDEATYAKVVVDTLKSGDAWSFTLSGSEWYEKPPLYLWLAMGSVRIFGEHEFAFRIPGIIASLLCLWLTYLIVRELTGSELTAASAFLVLLFTPFFYYFAKEVRLDSSVIAAILAAFWCWIKGCQNEKYLFWILPLAAVGFLFKSVIVFLLGPALLIYSFFYGRWAWLKSGYFWSGSIVSLGILIPWHAVQFVRFGHSFLDRYFLYDIYQRATTTITGTNNYYDYLSYLGVYSTLWFCVLLGAITLFGVSLVVREVRSTFPWKHVAAPLLIAMFILALFSVTKTHLSPYLLPALPFLAIFIALLSYHASLLLERRWYLPSIIVIALVVSGIYYYFSPIFVQVLPDVYDEVAVGKMYKENQLQNSAPLYVVSWKILETMNYYGDVKIQFLVVSDLAEKKFNDPFYLVTTVVEADYLFYVDNGTIMSKYENLHLLYLGDTLALIFSDGSTQFSKFFVLP